MKRIQIIILLIILLVMSAGCTQNQETSGGTITATATPTISAIVVESTPEPTPTPTPTPRPVIFHRIDDNPAEFAVCESTPSIHEIFSSGGGSAREDTLVVLYLKKDMLKSKKVIAEISSINAYTGGHAFMGSRVLTGSDANHIFISTDIIDEPLYGYYSRMYKNNGKIRYSLFELARSEIAQNSKDYQITNIVRFLEVGDNKIYFLSTDNNVYTFEMATQEIELVEGYEVIDYDTLPEEIDDYTAEYVLAYNNENKQIDITNIGIVDGAFVVDDLYQSLDCCELDGKVVDIKAGYDALFIAVEQDGITTTYRYSMYEETFEMLYQTEYEFDCSYVTQDDYFAVFYDGNYHIQAIKYSFKDSSNRIIYDGDTCAYWEHVSPNEDTVDEVVEHPRYKDINYMTYKGNMLFAFNIDKSGVTTLIFKTDIIDQELIERLSRENGCVFVSEMYEIQLDFTESWYSHVSATGDAHYMSIQNENGESEKTWVRYLELCFVKSPNDDISWSDVPRIPLLYIVMKEDLSDFGTLPTGAFFGEYYYFISETIEKDIKSIDMSEQDIQNIRAVLTDMQQVIGSYKPYYVETRFWETQ